MEKGECRGRHNRVIFTRDLGGDFAREGARGHLAYLSSFSLPLDNQSPSHHVPAPSYPPPPTTTHPVRYGRRGYFNVPTRLLFPTQFVIQKREDERAAGQIALLLSLPMPKRLRTRSRVTYGTFLLAFLSPPFFLFIPRKKEILTFFERSKEDISSERICYSVRFR